MNGYNVNADLAKNLEVYARFIEARSSVTTPEKLDVPMVWGMYLDTTRPIGEPSRLSMEISGSEVPQLLSASAPDGGLPQSFHASVRNPQQPQVLSTTLPEARIPDALPAMTQESRLPEPLAFSVRETAGPGESLAFDGAEADSAETAVSVTYRTPVSGDLDLLGLVNDRLKTQARRYPHPLSNAMDAFG